MAANTGLSAIYQRMNFPAYKFREYPKMIKHPNGTFVVVQDQREELNVLAQPAEATAETHPAELERDKLAQALFDAQAANAEMQAQLLELKKAQEELKAQAQAQGRGKAATQAPAPAPASAPAQAS